MAQFGPEAEKFRQLGVNVVFIAAEKRSSHVPRRGLFDTAEQYLQNRPAPFPYLFDEDRTVTKSYGVYHRLGLDAINIAHPATFVVDRNQVLRWIYIGSNQFDRAPIERVLQEAEKARS